MKGLAQQVLSCFSFILNFMLSGSWLLIIGCLNYGCSAGKFPLSTYQYNKFVKQKLLAVLDQNETPKEKKGKRKVQGVPQSQTATLPRPQEEEETDKSKQAQIEQTYEKH